MNTGEYINWNDDKLCMKFDSKWSVELVLNRVYILYTYLPWEYYWLIGHSLCFDNRWKEEVCIILSTVYPVYTKVYTLYCIYTIYCILFTVFSSVYCSVYCIYSIVYCILYTLVYTVVRVVYRFCKRSFFDSFWTFRKRIAIVFENDRFY